MSSGPADSVDLGLSVAVLVMLGIGERSYSPVCSIFFSVCRVVRES